MAANGEEEPARHGLNTATVPARQGNKGKGGRQDSRERRHEAWEKVTDQEEEWQVVSRDGKHNGKQWQGKGGKEEEGEKPVGLGLKAARTGAMALDLFSGTGSVKRALEENGYTVISVDIDERWSPDIKADVVRWKYWEQFSPGTFDIIAASPPCTEYSRALTTRPRQLQKADRIIRKVLQLIKWLAPKMWWIENPRWGLLRERPMMKHLWYVDIDYCMMAHYGYQKPTRFWVPQEVASRLAPVVCDGWCENMVEEDGRWHHRVRLGGRGSPKATTEQAYRIPKAVIEYLCGMHSAAATSTPQQPLQRGEAHQHPQRNPQEQQQQQSPQRGKEEVVHVRKVTVKPWQHRPNRPFRIGRMEARGGCSQLMLEVVIRVGEVRVQAKALVDTGAEATLVRRGLLPEGCFQESKRPLMLRTVSGDQLEGGRQEVVARVEFRAETEDGGSVNRPWVTEVRAHDGDVGCDIILGYPWLRSQRLDVQPWRDSLQLHDKPWWVLRDSRQEEDSDDEEEMDQVQVASIREEARSKTQRRARIATQGMATPGGGGDNAEEEEWDEEVRDTVEDIRKMRLALVSEVDMDTWEVVTEEVDDEESMVEAARYLRVLKSSVEEKKVRGVVLAEDEVPGEESAQYRKEILEEFNGTLFRDQVWPNPPQRGPHGMAELRLKAGAVPVVGRNIHLKGERLEAQKQLEADWKRDRKIEPGRGPWRAGAFPIKKKSGKWRGVCDYALTNKQIQADSYPLPLTEDIVSEQAQCEVFSTIDLRDAFHQVALDPASRPITNIQLPGGLFQFTVVPQGINNGPALLQRDVDSTCQPVEDKARPYFDDIIIGTRRGQGMEDHELLGKHAEDVRQVFRRLVEDKWVADQAKARLFMRRVEFVGHVLGGGRRTPAPGKLTAVQKWQLPPNVSALRGFLGLCNYYSGYVRMFAELAAPLQEKLKLPREHTRAGSKHPLTWTPEEEVAFERLKQALVADLELHHLDPRKPFALKTDASDYAVGAALEQFPNLDGVPELKDIKPGASVPVAFMSRKFSEGQRKRWDTRDKETYGVVSALDKWASYIGYNPVLVLTDHKSLESWHKEHIAGQGPVGRRARWHMKLNKFNLEVVHVPGVDNVVGDALSRWAYPASQAYEDVSWHGTKEDTAKAREEIKKERQEERECPKAQHPADKAQQEVDKEKIKKVEVAAIRLNNGTWTRLIRTEDGRELALLKITFQQDAHLDSKIRAFVEVPSPTANSSVPGGHNRKHGTGVTSNSSKSISTSRVQKQ